jgi:two-component system response regulator AtoC
MVMSAYGSHEDALAAIKARRPGLPHQALRPGDLAFTLRKAEEREALVRENKELRAPSPASTSFDGLVARSE